MMKEKKPAGGIVVSGIIFVIIGIIGMNNFSDSFVHSFNGHSLRISSSSADPLKTFGIVAIIAGFIAIAGGIFSHMMNKGNDEEDRSMISPEEGLRAEKAAADAVRNIHARQARENAGKWNCAYCDTMVDEEMSKCPACGAGRKK